MNQQLWSGLTTAALLITSLSTASASHAEQSQVPDETPAANVSLEESQSESAPADPAATEADAAEAADAVKVGEYQSQDEPEATEATIALIQPHDMSGRQAATVFVRNIPVLTFLGTQPTPAPAAAESASTESEVKVATDDSSAVQPASTAAEPASDPAAADDYTTDPIWRATAIAARLNQLHRDNLNAEAITVSWIADRERYVVRVNDQELIEINDSTILPDTTNNPAEDALQVTNRLRRLMGDAPPLSEIAGRPQPQPVPQQVVQRSSTILRGLASWYGPGFNGNRSASGEIFNQNAMTAAHRSLPFGTRVRVTNLRNGRSVVVRINDRGPFHGRRVIDLSAGAARAVGLVQMGVAPVSIDVLGAAGSLVNR